jgi:hypothetical protein
MSPRRRPRLRRVRRTANARALSAPKAIYGSHVLAQWEYHLSATAPIDLEGLQLAWGATLLLYDVLVGNVSAADGESTDGRRKMAIAHLSTMMLRTSRACLRVIALGYVQEAVALKRRITEAAHRTEKVRADASGEYAKQWLNGKPPAATSKLARSVGQSPRQWDFYSQGTHADARILPTQPEGQDKVLVLLTPNRNAKAANTLLTEIAIEVADQIPIVARELHDAELSGHKRERLDEINRRIEILAQRYYYGVSEGLNEMARTRSSDAKAN